MYDLQITKSKQALQTEIDDALSKYENYLNQGMTLLAMEYLNMANWLVSRMNKLQ